MRHLVSFHFAIGAAASYFNKVADALCTWFVGPLNSRVRRPVAGKIDVARRSSKDHHDLVDGCVCTAPSFPPGAGVVASLHRVRDVGLGRDPEKLRAPCPVRSEGPRRECHSPPGPYHIFYADELARDIVDELVTCKDASPELHAKGRCR